MTLEEARGRIGHGVIYRPTTEQGTITSVNEHWVFVRYGSDTGSKATDPALLAPLAASAVEPLREGDEEQRQDGEQAQHDKTSNQGLWRAIAAGKPYRGGSVDRSNSDTAQHLLRPPQARDVGRSRRRLASRR